MEIYRSEEEIKKVILKELKTCKKENCGDELFDVSIIDLVRETYNSIHPFLTEASNLAGAWTLIMLTYKQWVSLRRTVQEINKSLKLSQNNVERLLKAICVLCGSPYPPVTEGETSCEKG